MIDVLIGVYKNGSTARFADIEKKYSEDLSQIYKKNILAKKIKLSSLYSQNILKRQITIKNALVTTQ